MRVFLEKNSIEYKHGDEQLQELRDSFETCFSRWKEVRTFSMIIGNDYVLSMI